MPWTAFNVKLVFHFFLSKENKKFQITKVAANARSREYVGCVDWLRDADSLIPVEVKAKDNASASLNNLIKSGSYPDIRYGIKLCRKNIGFNGKFYTFPYFCTFLLRRWLQNRP